MTEQKDKKQTKTAVGYFFIAVGIFGIISLFIGEISWTTASIIKLCSFITALVAGLWVVLKKK